jgi:dihydrofolate reductase (trimethoprim resistance protein)
MTVFNKLSEGHWKFRYGDLVRKSRGSWWEGRVVGYYSTEQTPRGYAVQLPIENGPVQIYPEAALSLDTGTDPCSPT